MKRLVLAIVSVTGVVLAGCGSSGHGGIGSLISTNTGNAAVDATLTPLFNSMKSGAMNLDASITSGSINNPLHMSSSSATNIINIGGKANDGTVTSVSVTVTVTPSSDGSSTATATVTEPSTNFQFLSVTQKINAPQLSTRVPQGGLSGLATNGTGHAFIVVRATYTSTLSRTFANTSTSGATLVNVTGLNPAPAAGTVTSTGSGFQDFLVDYVITLGSSGLQARVNAIVNGSSQSTATRQGGPATSPLNQNFSALTVGSANLPANSDALAGVGGDANLSTNVPQNASVTFNFSLSGGVQGATPSTDVTDNVAPQVNGSSATTTTFTGNLNGMDKTGDGFVQIDRTFSASSSEVEDPLAGGSVKSSLDGNVGFAGNSKQILYLPNAADVIRVVYLAR